jgi:hypothetical protein
MKELLKEPGIIVMMLIGFWSDCFCYMLVILV